LPAPPFKTEIFKTRLEPADALQLRTLTARLGTTASQFIRHALRPHLRAEPWVGNVQAARVEPTSAGAPRKEGES